MGFWRRHWWADVILGVVAATALRTAPHTIIRVGDAGAVYAAVVAASAALGTLAITPIAIVLALTPGRRLRALLEHHVRSIRNAMAWTVLSNLAAVALGICGLVVDSAAHVVTPLRIGALALEAAALLAMARLVWFFVALLAVNEVDHDTEMRELDNQD